MREIPLSKGHVALVDDEDYEHLSQFEWRVHEPHKTKMRYAIRTLPLTTSGRRGQTIAMHREILGTPHGMDTDHINKNGLDNRRSNLRRATRSQNTARPVVAKRCGLTSRYRGVSLVKKSGRWKAQIQVQSEKRTIGYFPTEIAAARAYDEAASAAFGAFATLNFQQAE